MRVSARVGCGGGGDVVREAVLVCGMGAVVVGGAAEGLAGDGSTVTSEVGKGFDEEVIVSGSRVLWLIDQRP